MSGLFLEGFYLYDNFAQMIDGFHGSRWIGQGSDGGTVLDVTGGEEGQPALKVNFGGPSVGNAWAQFGFPLTTTIVFGFRVKLDANASSGSDRLIYFLNGASVTASVFISSAGELNVLMGEFTQRATTTTGPITDTNWHDVEIKISIQNSPLGAVSIVVDGVLLIDNATGFDLQQAGPAGADSIRLQADSDTDGTLWSDLYLLDADGAAPNDFLKENGEIRRVFALRPSGDSSVNFTPNPGPNNFAMVDDAGGHDFDSGFNKSAVVGDRDILSLPSPGTIGEVKLVQLNYAARTDDGGSKNVKGFQRQGAVQDDGATNAIAIAFNVESDVFAADANGAAWTKALLNSTTFGYEIV